MSPRSSEHTASLPCSITRCASVLASPAGKHGGTPDPDFGCRTRPQALKRSAKLLQTALLRSAWVSPVAAQPTAMQLCRAA